LISPSRISSHNLLWPTSRMAATAQGHIVIGSICDHPVRGAPSTAAPNDPLCSFALRVWPKDTPSADTPVPAAAKPTAWRFPSTFLSRQQLH
jgi:hypothetical protein